MTTAAVDAVAVDTTAGTVTDAADAADATAAGAVGDAAVGAVEVAARGSGTRGPWLRGEAVRQNIHMTATHTTRRAHTAAITRRIERANASDSNNLLLASVPAARPPGGRDCAARAAGLGRRVVVESDAHLRIRVGSAEGRTRAERCERDAAAGDCMRRQCCRLLCCGKKHAGLESSLVKRK